MNGRFTGPPAENDVVEELCVMGMTLVVQASVVPLQPEVVTKVVGVAGAVLLLTWNVIEVVGYTGIPGLKPPLQDGGVQAALMSALPEPFPETVPTLPNTVLVVGVTEITPGELDIHVSGMPVMSIPTLSVTLAFSVACPVVLS